MYIRIEIPRANCAAHHSIRWNQLQTAVETLNRFCQLKLDPKYPHQQMKPVEKFPGAFATNVSMVVIEISICQPAFLYYTENLLNMSIAIHSWKIIHSEFEVTSWRRLHTSETVLPAHHSSSPTFHHFRQLWAELSVFGRNPLQIKTPTFLVSLFCLCVVRDTKRKNHTSGNDEIIKIIHKDFHSCSLSLGIIIHFPVVGDDMPENIAGQMQRTGGMKTATYAECGGDNARTYRTRTIRGQVCVCHMKSEFTYAIWICMAYLCSMKGTE